MVRVLSSALFSDMREYDVPYNDCFVCALRAHRLTGPDTLTRAIDL